MRNKLLKRALVARAEKALSEELPIDQRTMRRIGWLLDTRRLKRIAVVTVGGAVAFNLIGDISRARMIRRAMARELKKQLAPLNKKIEELQRQNEELQKQNRQLEKRLEHAR